MEDLDAIIAAISTFPLGGPVNDELLDRLDEHFEQLVRVAQKNFVDPTRGVCLCDVAPSALCVLRHVLRLRRQLDDENEAEESLVESAAEAQRALKELLKLSFDDECRKAEVSLGLVTVVAEWLVLDSAVFGCQREKWSRETRRAIGNCLTNLTFGNSFAKKTLCGHEGFLSEVTKLVDFAPELVQSFGALIRNLSWNADSGMIEALAQTVPSLARTIVRLHNSQELSGRKESVDDGKCLLSAAAALWNLSAHSVENKRALCETPGFLFFLISNLSNEPDRILLVENYSGVLKYVAGYIAEQEELLALVHECKIVRHLLSLLNSSSFTVILNSLGALAPLTAKDPRTQLKLLHNEQGRMVLENLRNSVREDVRIQAKTVLTNLNSSPLGSARMGQYKTMSMPRGSTSSRSGFSTVRRGMRLCAESSDGPSGVTSNQRLLPQRQGWQHFVQTPEEGPPATASERRDPPTPVDLGESALGTGVGSLQSLTADLPSGEWPSNVTTARNSGLQSPFSPSNLPDSPSDFFHERLDEGAARPLDHPGRRHRIRRNHEPQSRKSAEKSSILEESIMRVMPLPKARHLLQNSSLFECTNTMERVRDASDLELQQQENHSDDNFCIAELSNGVVDVHLPKDVHDEFEAEQLEIDCMESKRNTRPSRLPSASRQSTGSQTRTPNSMRSALVPPFNYKHPSKSDDSSVSDREEGALGLDEDLQPLIFLPSIHSVHPFLYAER
ncbi:hypothetical protein M3Y99_00790900 [Aphelenchoides fujianensis]|nr:hypothetical protein M3Y99_00790900 [Aphelenchoides fujianensis]